MKTRRSRPRFVIRTIRNGTVTIFGQQFQPDDGLLKYDGRLDGLRYAFGLYWRGDFQLPLLNMWGTEDEYRDGRTFDGPDVVDGTLPWAFWRPTGAGKEE
ncbi:MAG: hypothetical protein AB1760_00115 [Pseudomonadota bacterium]